MSDIVFDNVGPWLTIRFRATSLTDPLKLAQFRDAVEQRLGEAGTKPQLLISFKHVDAVSSQVIGLLLELQAKTKQAKGKLVLTNLGDNVAHVLKLTRLDRQFDIQPSASTILAGHLKKRSSSSSQPKGDEIDWLD